MVKDIDETINMSHRDPLWQELRTFIQGLKIVHLKELRDLNVGELS